jgi:hypothetical protein
MQSKIQTPMYYDVSEANKDLKFTTVRRSSGRKKIVFYKYRVTDLYRPTLTVYKAWKFLTCDRIRLKATENSYN